ncbi:hypothetical protein VN97_g2170 [Penicillium thymicola]|uniref:Uncharacterized protein n=1 Tax=Penicillium thymicola TaxID=293382 RepID=A0AAI9XBC9_PENTH|nr:hypothetical protein VN97_g2170 [Penicillium thymicola]
MKVSENAIALYSFKRRRFPLGASHITDEASRCYNKKDGLYARACVYKGSKGHKLCGGLFYVKPVIILVLLSKMSDGEFGTLTAPFVGCLLILWGVVAVEQSPMHACILFATD